MRKIVLAALVLGIPAAWAYFAHQWFGWHVVVYPNGDTWQPLSSGWETLWKAWPVLTAGLVLALLGAIVMLSMVSMWSEQLEQSLRDEAKQRLAEEISLQRDLAQDHQHMIQKRADELEASWESLRAREQQMAAQLAEMQARIEDAEAKAADAEARRMRAYGGFERIRRKQNREKEERAAMLDLFHINAVIARDLQPGEWVWLDSDRGRYMTSDEIHDEIERIESIIDKGCDWGDDSWGQRLGVLRDASERLRRVRSCKRLAALHTPS